MKDADTEMTQVIKPIGDLEDRIPDLMDHLADLKVNEDLRNQAVNYLLEATKSHINARPRICLLGKVGSGKTCLANAILNVDLLPSAASAEDDSGYATTSAVTEIMHDPKLSPGQYRISVCQATEEEWQNIKRFLVQATIFFDEHSIPDVM